MLALKYIQAYPVPDVLDSKIERLFQKTLDQIHPEERKKASERAILIFRVYLDIASKPLNVVQLEQEELMSPVMREFFGFVFSLYDVQYAARARLCNFVSEVLNEASKKRGTNLSALSFERYHSENLENYISEFNLVELNPIKLSYYEGWFINFYDGDRSFINLSRFHIHYGPELTNKVIDGLNKFMSPWHSNSIGRHIGGLQSLFSSLFRLCPTKKSMQLATSPNNIDLFVRQLFADGLLETKRKNLSIHHYYTRWYATLKCIKTVFIEQKIWSELLFDPFCPKWKSSSGNTKTHKYINEEGNAFNNKLVTHIPLYYTDNQAIEALLKSIEQDIKHVSVACERQVLIIMNNFERRKRLAAEGAVRFHRKHPDYPGLGNNAKVGSDYTANQCATWEYYNFSLKENVKVAFTSYIKSDANFAKDYSLLHPFILYPILFLLVQEHPAITDSWLREFELFDTFGKEKGFRRAGNVWIAVSVKRRKGVRLGQQLIVLNDTSKRLFDNIITLTADARSWLRKKGNENWRYLLLTCKEGFSAPSKISALLSFRNPRARCSPIGKELLLPSRNIDEKRTQEICNNLNLSSFRASCGVQVYLRTRSVKAMSEALGHNKYDPRLLSSYLPEPILSYFQGRWIRIFQNSLIYETMKNSKYVLDAIDFDENGLEIFLRNHRLKPLSEHLVGGETHDLLGAENLNCQFEKPDGIIPISSLLLQVLNAVVLGVENIPKNQSLTATAETWYETAKFVLESIITTNKCNKISEALTTALANPLPNGKINGALYA